MLAYYIYSSSNTSGYKLSAKMGFLKPFQTTRIVVMWPMVDQFGQQVSQDRIEQTNFFVKALPLSEDYFDDLRTHQDLPEPDELSDEIME